MTNTYEHLNNKKYLTLSDVVSTPALSEISQVLNISNPRQILYHAVHNVIEIPRCNCGTVLQWHPDKREYRKYCSKKCTAIFSVAGIKLNNLKKLGVEWHSQTAEWANKVQETSVKKYGISHYSKTAEHAARVKETNIKNFGVEYPSQSRDVQDRLVEKHMVKYGVSNPMQTEASKARIKQFNLDTLGVTCMAQRHFTPETRALLSDDAAFAAECLMLSVKEISTKYGISVGPIYSKVKELGIVLPNFNQNTFEKSVTAFIQSLYSGSIVLNTYNILGNRQLDIWLPELNIAIECNGSYWHSELNGRTKNYHLDKSTRCAELGIRILHIWEHDWNQRQDIIKSKLSTVFQKNIRIFARQCIKIKISSAEARVFFTANHLQGHVNAGVAYYALQYQGELLAVMSFSKSRFKNASQWELLRFANKLNFTIVGGASKLFQMFLKEYSPESIVSYSDRSINHGNLYLLLGFKLSHTSQPNYFYTQDYQTFFSRNKFQKHLLKDQLNIFSDSLTEWENMKNNNWDRIWDCGNNVYTYTLT